MTGAVAPTRTFPVPVVGAALVNVFLGYGSLIPMVFLWGALLSGPFRDLGWSTGTSPFDEDEVAVVSYLSLVFLVPVVAGFVALNLLARPKSNAATGAYWAGAVLLFFLPLLVALATGTALGLSAA